jgi:cyanophycinase
MSRTPGILALVGGGEWSEGCSFDAELLAASGSDEVLVLPTAAAYEHPERLVVEAGEWFAPLGGRVEGLMVLSRADAEDSGAAAVLQRARFIYLCGSSPMHLRSVLKNSVGVGGPGRGLAGRCRGGRLVRARPWPSPTRWSTPGAGD